ncbi:MAG: tyrosine-protein phosphatase [Acutalibacteraceae bacterium]|nr:tyrosine-protein phosphatase [Oscillospiraceae bacterium]
MGRIKLKKLVNTRDLGGYKTLDGRKIKEKRLIRSETLFDATPEDKAVLTGEYGLRTVVDFRTDIEREQKPDPVIDGVENIFDPILEAETLGITRESVNMRNMPKLFDGITLEPMEYMRKMYTDIVLDKHAQNGYAVFFDVLLRQESGSVLWHCSAGKDRVGVGTALLMTVLGVDRETIINDYLLTGHYYRATNLRLKLLIDLFVKNKRTKTYLKYLLDVKREYIEAAFDAIESGYGTVEHYLEATMGLDAEKREALRRNYLE